MTMRPAARVEDDIAHSNAVSNMLLGIAGGLVLGTVLVAATVATGGLALVAAVGAGAGLVSAGGLAGKYIGEGSMGAPCGKFVTGSPNVYINDRPATMTFASFAACGNHASPIPLATGSSTVFINGGMAGREGETLACSAKSIARCSPNVSIGGESAADPRVTIKPEVPAWAVTTLQVLGIAGAVMALPYAIATVGVAATVGSGVLGYYGAEYGGKGARMLGEAMGMSESNIRKLEVAGGFLGGMAGGAAGAKGAGALGNRMLPKATTPLGVTLRQGRTGNAPTYSPEVVANARRLGIAPSKVQQVLDTPKADRPLPSDYVGPRRMAEHGAAFENGASRLTLESSVKKYGLGQRDGTTFVSTSDEVDGILSSAGSDPRKLESALGLPKGQLDGEQLVRVDFNKDAMRDLDVRMPRGNEAGANDQWLPGGLLPGGQNEAVINGANALPGHYKIKGVP